MKLTRYISQNKIDKAVFADDVGVTIQSLYRYLSGDRFPKPEIIQKIIAATNGEVTANDFLPDPEHGEAA